MRTLARARDTADVLQRLRTLRPDSARRWGRMSAHQMVCHVADAFRMALGDKPVSPVRGLVPALVLRWGALYAPVPWPRGIPTRLVVTRYVLKNASIPMITVLLPLIPDLLTGSIFIEAVFSVPGLGRFFTTSALTRDYPMVMAMAMSSGRKARAWRSCAIAASSSSRSISTRARPCSAAADVASSSIARLKAASASARLPAC